MGERREQRGEQEGARWQKSLLSLFRIIIISGDNERRRRRRSFVDDGLERMDPRLSRVASSTKPLAPRTSSSPKSGLREHFIAFNPREGARSLGEASSAGRRLDLGEQEICFVLFFASGIPKKAKKNSRPLKELAPDESTRPPFRSASVTQNRYSPLPQEVAEAKAGEESSLELARGEQKRWQRKKKNREKTHRKERGVRELEGAVFRLLSPYRGDSLSSQRNERFSHCHKISESSLDSA